MDTKQRLSQMRGEAQLMAGESVVDAMRERRERAEAQEAKAQRRQLAQARARARCGLALGGLHCPISCVCP